MVPMPKNLNLASAKDIKTFLSSFDTVLSDCDGVLWLERELIENSENVMNKFMDMGKKIFYVTNNNSYNREEYAEKCQKLGFRASKDNIICTSFLAADYLKSINFNKKVYVIGNEGIMKELDKVGIKHTEIGPDPLGSSLESYITEKLTFDPEIGAVLIGFDTHFSYPKILKAATYLNNPDSIFLATCSDETFPVGTHKQFVFPGTGALVKCLEGISGRKAFILGKPGDYVKQAVHKMHKIDPKRTLMIGDRCNTDILFGKRCGFQTLLVMSGVTTLSDVEKFAQSTDPDTNALVPDNYINKLGDLLPYMLD